MLNRVVLTPLEIPPIVMEKLSLVDYVAILKSYLSEEKTRKPFEVEKINRLTKDHWALGYTNPSGLYSVAEDAFTVGSEKLHLLIRLRGPFDMRLVSRIDDPLNQSLVIMARKPKERDKDWLFWQWHKEDRIAIDRFTLKNELDNCL